MYRAQEMVMSKKLVDEDIKSWLVRPSNAGLIIRNESGLTMDIKLPLLAWESTLKDRELAEIQFSREESILEEASFSSGKSNSVLRCEISAASYLPIDLPVRESSKMICELLQIPERASSEISRPKQVATRLILE
eukprot:Plantae.Rhodophyta-Purpureofilum_apyrenoidigerum.ctg48032.p2 GENE.Plantae.Rhodophyta-Purpureofilum_apyrenoidigerum.ctg48032~~Plantae.Rhodophyta-Purpureofilum_apyrenoidigerum.ctg48032.p2  ORF type:complete len:135 (+),score=28.20 Plantae.Rhodophyta-Purpureofilum_apyrenoidigerum.ctg48032:491-895(+)